MLDIVVVRRRGLVERVYVVSENGEARIVAHRPWFLVGIDKPLTVRAGYDVEPTSYEMMVFNSSRWSYEPSGLKVYKVSVNQPYEVREYSEYLVARGYKVSMNNIRYEARVSLDYADTFMGTRIPLPLSTEPGELEQVLLELREKTKDLVFLAFDTEVASSTGGFPRPGDKVFIASVCKGSLGDEDPECWLLEMDNVHDLPRVIEEARPRYIVGFNSEGFDIPYLAAYTRDNRLAPWGYVGQVVVPHIDLQTVLDQHGSSFGLPQGARLALDDVAARMGLATEEELAVESSVERSRIYEEYKRDPERVRRYALMDARLTWRIGRVVLDTLLSLYALTGVAPSVIQRLPTLGALAEYTVFDIVRRKWNRVYELRSTKYTARELASWWGPYAKHTKEQFTDSFLDENIAEYDYNMLYPSIYYSDKLDPEGFEPAPPGKGFLIPLVRRDKEEPVDADALVWGRSRGGPVYEVLRYFYEARKVTKKLKKMGYPTVDQAVKILANSAYGMFSKTRGMGVNEAAGAWIFFRSNQILLGTVGFVEQVLRRRVVYTATDAVFVKLLDGDDPGALGEEINRAVQVMFGKAYSLKLETVCRRFALLKRKTYICVGDGETIVKGLEKLALPYAVKTSIEEVFRAELVEGNGKELLDKIIGGADLEDLFVKTSKRPSELYDEEEKRFKNLNHNSLKATLLRWLYENQALMEKTVVSMSVEELVDYPVISRWLGSNELYLLLEARGDRARVARCRLAEQRPGRDRLEALFVCRFEELGRRSVERLSREKARTVYEYLGLIRRLRSRTSLDRFL